MYPAQRFCPIQPNNCIVKYKVKSGASTCILHMHFPNPNLVHNRKIVTFRYHHQENRGYIDYPHAKQQVILLTWKVFSQYKYHCGQNAFYVPHFFTVLVLCWLPYIYPIISSAPINSTNDCHSYITRSPFFPQCTGVTWRRWSSSRWRRTWCTPVRTRSRTSRVSSKRCSSNSCEIMVSIGRYSSELSAAVVSTLKVCYQLVMVHLDMNILYVWNLRVGVLGICGSIAICKDFVCH